MPSAYRLRHARPLAGWFVTGLFTLPVCGKKPQDMATGGSHSIVEYLGGDDGHRCGYCKNKKGNFSHGMWSHVMTVQDYQDLIDRGWRRSGKYVYKPAMNKTCCPQYTIRCHALNFHPSKTHKKILKRMKKFLSNGELPLGQPQDACGGVFEEIRDFLKPLSSSVQRTVTIAAGISYSFFSGEPMEKMLEEDGSVPPVDPAIVQRSEVEPPVGHSSPEESRDGKAAVLDASKAAAAECPLAGKGSRIPPKAGVGADPSRPPCRKAKDIRKARRLQKEHQKQEHGGVATTLNPAPSNPTYNQAKGLEEFISDLLPDDLLHNLEVRLVRSAPPSPQFLSSFNASYQVYKLYQMAIHHYLPGKPRENQFKRFLCDSPLEAETPPDGPNVGYGSFHQQYWLDGCLIAVGVIDILPRCVSSVYLYYHPDFAGLSLGTYSALREIAFTRQLHKQSPKLAYYYLGFYIHSCPKMRYKGQYRPSDLLCPETYTWVPIERCIPWLDTSPYARLAEDNQAGDAVALRNLGKTLVLHRRAIMPYTTYIQKRKGPTDEKEVQQYASLVGQTCAERILLYRA
ncbi:arginyl-tRNA--protein transferase 1 isoform X1 [Electrophorus electricus]|uniref:arginyl-tRNA--protein transferase 1 isoform X1 n=1 Tax=Electrophorus electricus TaxID=8005 RepID=UPI0015CFA480|nr:arginyl-tRNA--protein transferase 1 isoform X1 [Electrophorus electricus]